MLLAVVTVAITFAVLSMLLLQMEMKLARQRRETEKNEYLLELALAEMRAGLSSRAGEVWAECVDGSLGGEEDTGDEESFGDEESLGDEEEPENENDGQDIAENFCERMVAELEEDSAAEYLKRFSVTLEEEFLEVEADAPEIADGEIVIPEVRLTYMPEGRKTRAMICVDLALRVPEGRSAAHADTEDVDREDKDGEEARGNGGCLVVVKRWLYAPRVR